MCAVDVLESYKRCVMLLVSPHICETTCRRAVFFQTQFCSVDISIQHFVFGWLHSLPTLVPLNKPTIGGLCLRLSHWKKKDERLRYRPLLIFSRTSLVSESDLWTCCVNRSKVLHFIHIFLFSWWKKKCHKTIETLMQICKMTLFDKFWIIRSISFFPLICYLTVWACACLCVSVCVIVWVCECVWREDEKGKEREC